MIHVVAIITAVPGQRAALLDLFRSYLPAVHAEDGCIAYQPVIDTPGMGWAQTSIGDDSFAVIEQWVSLDALKAHGAAPHMAAYAAAAKPLTAGRVLHIFSPA